MPRIFLTATITDAMVCYSNRYTSTPLAESEVRDLLRKGVVESLSFRNQREKIGHEWLIREIRELFKGPYTIALNPKAIVPTTEDQLLFVFLEDDSSAGSCTSKFRFCLIKR